MIVYQQFLPDADALKVHAEYRGHAHRLRAIVIQALNLVHDRRHFQGIVLHGAYNAQSVVVAADVRDLRGVQVVDALARAAVHQIIGGMLVRPRGAAGTLRLDHLKHGVGTYRIVRIKRDAVSRCVQVAGQRIRIDDVLRNPVHVHVDRLVENHLRSGRPGAGLVIRRPNRAVIAVIVKKAMSARRTSRHEREQSRKRIRVRGSPRIGERDATPGQFGERRSRMRFHIIGDVHRVQTVDTDQQYMFDLSLRQPVVCLGRSRIDRRHQAERSRCCE